jgi:hypothetical protein
MQWGDLLKPVNRLLSLAYFPLRLSLLDCLASGVTIERKR